MEELLDELKDQYDAIVYDSENDIAYDRAQEILKEVSSLIDYEYAQYPEEAE